MNEHDSPLTTTPAPLDSKPGRRVSAKALGLLAAAAVSAGTIGSITLMSNPSAAETPPPTPVVVDVDSAKPTNILPRSIDELDTNAPASVDYESWTTDEHNWDDCPACGMG